MQEPHNPYSAPSTVVADIPTTTGEHYAAPARRVSAGHGRRWISEGWRIFKEAPLLWVAVMVLIFIISGIASTVPVVGDALSNVLGPSLMIGVMSFARAIARGEGADFTHAFDGFRQHLLPLLGVGLLYIVLVLAAFAIVAAGLFISIGNTVLLGELMDDPQQAITGLFTGIGGLTVMLGAVVLLALMALIMAAYWFAAPLVFFAGMGPIEAMYASFNACLRNWLPLLVYGILAFLVVIGGLLALGIGLLVALPVLSASAYVMFNDLFGQDDTAA
ncbi:MAG: BPSS1780 family membrane protein [Moraxellaceae bacterium]|nr:BPSS1780 family membrane protein [Moraxellaceae bacterium]